MSVSHCMHHATAIAALPLAEWGARIEALPDGCAHADCGAPRNCRERIREYLRMQVRTHQRRERMRLHSATSPATST